MMMMLISTMDVYWNGYDSYRDVSGVTNWLMPRLGIAHCPGVDDVPAAMMMIRMIGMVR